MRKPVPRDKVHLYALHVHNLFYERLSLIAMVENERLHGAQDKIKAYEQKNNIEKAYIDFTDNE